MKTMFSILLFMVIFNIAAVTVAYTGFFGEDTLYSDFVSDDPQSLSAPETIIENLWRDPIDNSLPTYTIPYLNIGLAVFSWSFLTIGIFLFAILIGKVMHAAPSIIAAAMVGSIFLLMYASSKKVFEQVTESLEPVANYFMLMIGVAFFIIALITIMDYISGQNAASGR